MPNPPVLEGADSSPHFLLNAWYVAGWSNELVQSGMLARTILGMPILMFRDDTGLASAIGDRCPHRMAPLHLGKVENGHVTCGYHGLAFGKDGSCVRNPHGAIGSLAVPSYVLAERDGILWLWPGEAERANPADITSFASLDDETHFVGRGHISGDAHYELMSDNILDLSHIEFLHPALGTPSVSAAKVIVRQEDDLVVATRTMCDEILPPGLGYVYRSGERKVDRTMEVVWRAPANLALSVTIGQPENTEFPQTGSQSLHFFTPQSDRSTHYFYSGSLPRATADIERFDKFFAALSRAFLTEDKPMIDGQQSMLGEANIMDLKPALLPIDKAGVLARRELARLIKAENG